MWTFFIKNFRTTILLTSLIWIVGLSAYFSMPRENNPEVQIPIVTISTLYPGASAQDIETLITDKIEREIKSIEDIKNYTSTSSEGISSVVVEFWNADNIEDKEQEVSDAVDNIKRDLPTQILDDPQVDAVSFSNTPILSFSLSGDYSFTHLKKFGEILEEEIENFSEIKNVTIDGLPEEKIFINIDPIALEQSGLSIGQITQILQSYHQDIPAGNIKVGGNKVSVRINGEYKTVQDIQEVPLSNNLYLKDIARIWRGFEPNQQENILYKTNQNLPLTRGTKGVSRTITLNVLKNDQKINILNTVESIWQKLEQLKKDEKIPQNISIIPVFDGAQDIKESLGNLQTSALQTILIIAVILYLVLGRRSGLLALVSLPMTMLMGIIFLNFFGQSFNFLTLFALVLSLGLLVDNAIIVLESIAEKRSKGLSPKEAATKTISEFKAPLITGTLTTICAFLPMLWMISGVSGDFISAIPQTITLVLLSSLFIALLIIPAISGNIYRKPVGAGLVPAQQKNSKQGHPQKQTQKTSPPDKGEQGGFIQKFQKKYEAWYVKTMQKILEKKSSRWTVIISTIIAFISGVFLVISGIVSKEIFPSSDETYFTASIEFPTGTDFETTKKVLPILPETFQEFSQKIEKDALKNILVTIGGKSTYDPEGQSRGLSGTQFDPEIIGFTINLTEKKSRKQESGEIAKIFKEVTQNSLKSASLHQAKIQIAERESGPPSGNFPIVVRLTGDEISSLEEKQKTIAQELEKIKLKNGDSLQNITLSNDKKITQISYTLDREYLSEINLTPSTIQSVISSSLTGRKVLEVSEGENTIDTEIKLDFSGEKNWSDPESLQILSQIPIQISPTENVSLDSIAELSLASVSPSINHRDGKRILTVSAKINGTSTPDQFKKSIQEILNKTPKNPGENFSIGGESEESNLLVQEMGNAMLLGLFLILLVLVIQFDSFKQSFIVLSLVPLSLTGVFWGFAISQTPISFPTMIGIVSLAGIIVNDAIVFVARYNALKKQESTLLSAHKNTFHQTNLSPTQTQLYKQFIGANKNKSTSNKSPHEASALGGDLEGDSHDNIPLLIESGRSRLQPILLTSITTILGLLPLALSDPIWSGLGFAIIYGMTLATFLTLFFAPCLLYKKHKK